MHISGQPSLLTQNFVNFHRMLALHCLILSCISNSPQESCHRLYHDEGKHCTLVEWAEHIHKAVFMPGDPSMMYCTTTRGVTLLNLRALPECAAFCQAGEQKLRPTTAACKGNAVRKQSTLRCTTGHCPDLCVAPSPG